MSWLPVEVDRVPKVRCDLCTRTTHSRYDRQQVLPDGWMAAPVRAEHLCPPCFARVDGPRPVEHQNWLVWYVHLQARAAE